jgi:hypothetical protein
MSTAGSGIDHRIDALSTISESLIPRIWKHARSMSWSLFTANDWAWNRERTSYLPFYPLHDFSTATAFHARDYICVQILSILLDLQFHNPRSVTGLHLTTNQLPTALVTNCLTAWGPHLRQVTLCLPDLNPSIWVPLLLSSPLTHLAADLGDRTIDTIDHLNAPPIDLELITTLVAKPGSRISSLELRFRDNRPRAQKNTTQGHHLATLVEQLPPQEHLTLSLPTRTPDSSLTHRNWFTETLSSLASNEVFTPLQLAVTAMTFAPSTYVPLRGPTLFEAFPFLNTLHRLYADARLVAYVAALAISYQRRNHPFRLTVHCRPCVVNSDDYVALLECAARYTVAPHQYLNTITVTTHDGDPGIPEDTTIDLVNPTGTVHATIHIPIVFKLPPLDFFH